MGLRPGGATPWERGREDSRRARKRPVGDIRASRGRPGRAGVCPRQSSTVPRWRGWRRPSRSGETSEDGDLGDGGRRGAALGGASGEVVEDAADHSRLGDEGNHEHHTPASRTDQRIGLVDPANWLGAFTTKGGQRGGRLGSGTWREGGRRSTWHRRSLRARPRGRPGPDTWRWASLASSAGGPG